MPHKYVLKTHFNAAGNFRINYKEELNEEQLPIVTASGGPMLVIAGAGSGKTRTITYRVAYLVESGIPLDRILLVTFTNKAAKEMLSRVEMLLKRDVKGIWGGTFHHVGNILLRRHADLIGYQKNYTILDRGDSKELIDSCITEANIDVKARRFPKGDTLNSIFGLATNKGKSITDIVAYNYPQFESLTDDIEGVQKRYKERKRKHNLMDFDDLLFLWWKLLAENPDVAEKYSRKFLHVLVDEYQDTNLIQAKIVDILASRHRNLMAVGDDSQCLKKGTKIKTPEGYKKVEDINNGEIIFAGGGNGRLVKSKIINKKVSHHSKYLEIKTKKNKRLCASQNHLCFAKLRSRPGYWYVYLMYRDDYGFRIGITNLPKHQKSDPRIQTRTSFEKAERMWLLEAHASRQLAQYREGLLSLRHQIPQALFYLEERKNRTMKMMHRQTKVIFSEFGQNGFTLLEDFGLLFDYPTYIPKASRTGRRISINLLMASASNRKSKRQRQGHELCIESYLGREIVKNIKGVHLNGKYWRLRRHSSDYKSLLNLAKEIKNKLEKREYRAVIVYKAKFLSAKNVRGSFRIVPAAALLPGMLVPVVNNEEMMLGEISLVKRKENKEKAPFYDLEVEKSHNIISNGIVTHNSIYSFRGAHFKNIMNFPKVYKDAKLFKLETNHRSTPEILNLANESISQASEKFNKTLRAHRPEGEKPVVLPLATVHEQASFVAQRMLELRAEGLSLNDMAMLYRSHYQSMEVQMELTKRGIPFEIRSGIRFFEEAHIKDVMAHLKIFHNPCDEISWSRILKIIERIGPRTAEKIFQAINQSEKPLEEILNERILKLVPKGGERGFKEFQALLIKLDELKETPAEMIKAISESSYEQHLKNQYPNYRERLEDLEQLGSYSTQFKNLEELLSALALVSGIEAETVVEGSEGDKEACVLTTIHQAKGLEWKAVFVVWLADGKFPSYLSFGKDEEMEEERRLFYVAVTRAKDQLYLTYPLIYSGYDGEVLMKTSRYLEELPESLYEKWEVEEEGSEKEEVIDLSDYQHTKVSSRKDDFEAVDIKDLDFMK
ncbi:MAG: UvrD-helicase domain-containing protein [Candidatus Margulisiibacteriota bacterium]|nr:UvrD-helicase domain-containing protein [Candidatus Margulisiibacteriota bacterium]